MEHFPQPEFIKAVPTHRYVPKFVLAQPNMQSASRTSSGDVSPGSLTPAQTPVSGLNLGSAAPKYGTVIPNRIFVGGISGSTSESELRAFFSSYGEVKDSKIIADRAGVSKGYGFVTFETQEDAEKIIKKESENLIFKDRKLNIGPAVRKQQAFPRPDAPFSPVMFTNGIPYTFQNGMAVFHGQDGNAYTTLSQTQASPYQTLMLPQQVFLPQQTAQYTQAAAAYQTAATALAQQTAPQHWASAAAATQWRWPTQCAAPTLANGGYVLTTGTDALSANMMYAPPTQGYPTSELSEALIDTHSAETSTANVVNVGQEVTSYNQGRDLVMENANVLVQTPLTQKYYTQVSPSPRKHYSTPMSAIRGAKAPRLVSKVVNGTTINVLSPHDSIYQTQLVEHEYDYNQPLTPPPTPQQLHRKA